MRNLKQILLELGIITVTIPNYEADDAIASLTNKFVNQELDRQIGTNNYSLEIIISSGDKDLFQLVDNSLKITVAYPKQNKPYDEVMVFHDFGVKPWQIADYKARRLTPPSRHLVATICTKCCVGDNSDNIPGVMGIGQISTQYLLNSTKLNNCEAIAKNYSLAKKAIAKKLEPEISKMLMFKQITKLKTDLNIELELSQLDLVNVCSTSATANELDVNAPQLILSQLQC